MIQDTDLVKPGSFDYLLAAEGHDGSLRAPSESRIIGRRQTPPVPGYYFVAIGIMLLVFTGIVLLGG